MTIYYVGAFRFPIFDAAASRVLQNAKLFQDCGYQVKVISFGGKLRIEDKIRDDVYVYSGVEYNITNEIDIKYKNIFSHLFGYLFCGNKTISFLKSKLRQNDTVVMYNPSFIYSIRLKKLCKKKKCQLLSDITEWYDQTEIIGGKWLPFYWLYELNMRKIQKSITKKIVISSFLQHYYNGQKVICLPPLVDLSDSKWMVMGHKVLLPPYDGIRIVYAGSPGKSKDLLLMMIRSIICCLEKENKLQLIIIGVDNTNNEYLSIEEQTVYKDNFLFLGKVSQNEVPKYYNESNFSLFIRESNRKNMAGFPTKFVESMTSHCPVITNLTSDLKDYLIDGYNGYIVGEPNQKAIVKVLSRLCYLDKHSLEIMKDNAFQTTVNFLNYTKYIDKMSSFIK